MIPEKLLTTKQASELLNRTPNTLRTWASKKWDGKRPITPVQYAPFAPLRWKESDCLRLLEGKNEDRN